MNSKEQQAILQVRERVLSIVDTEVGQLETRLKLASADISLLAHLILTWVDTTAINYKAAGCERQEWQDDIREWFVLHQFFVDDDSTARDALWRVHLSVIGWGRHVILTFTLK